MEIQNASAPPITLRSVITVRWECRNISTQPREIDDTNSEVIGLVVNACRNVIANTFLYLNLGEKKFVCLKYVLYSTENLLDIYREYFYQIQCY